MTPNDVWVRHKTWLADAICNHNHLSAQRECSRLYDLTHYIFMDIFNRPKNIVNNIHKLTLRRITGDFFHLSSDGYPQILPVGYNDVSIWNVPHAIKTIDELTFCACFWLAYSLNDCRYVFVLWAWGKYLHYIIFLSLKFELYDISLLAGSVRNLF